MKNDLECPKCGSKRIARILWGMPAFTEELERDLEEGRIVLGGCCISEDSRDWECRDCGCRFGENIAIQTDHFLNREGSLKGVVYGAAVGDALGVPYEFMGRDSFECTGMVGGGAHKRPAGTFSDDTSLLLATCASIKDKGKIDVEDMRSRFRDWLYSGVYTADGVVFDVGNATATALEQRRGCDGEHSNGNGSLMRIAPLAFMATSDDDVRAVSAITHAHWISTESCVALVRILDDLAFGEDPMDAINANTPRSKKFAFLSELESMPRHEIRSGGFVLDTLAASLWCLLHTDNFKDCVLAAVNLGDDSDTTGCVAGALAGAAYGYDAIPEEWIGQLRGKEVIEDCLF